MVLKSKLKIVLLIISLSFLLTGCWSIVGVEKSLVHGDNVNMQYLYYGIIALFFLFLVQILLIKRRVAQRHLEETITSLIVFTALSFTIVGAFNAWLWGSITHWNVMGIIICVILSFGGGLRGFFPIMGFILYWLYKDANLLYYVALPNSIGYLFLTISLFFRAKSILNNAEE